MTPDGTAVTCPGCGQANPGRARFCQECGTRLPVSCARCGSPLPVAAKFCVECGQAVAGGTAAPSAFPGAASPTGPIGPTLPSPEAYTPHHLAERILASRSALEGERKPVTVLFCDLVESTALAGRLGPEGMHGLLNDFFETALAEVHRYEGTINQFLGDGFMALFGAPLAHEDHARRGVLAALGIRQALADRPPGGGQPGPIRVRMGIHTGQVVVGAIGDNLRMDYTAIGDTTHLAARLQQVAEPDTICVSAATARMVEGYVRLLPLGPMSLKGVSEPVAVSRVLGVGSRRSALEGAEAGPLSPFVGRTREVAILEDLVGRIEGGRGQAVGIVGEPGVGKSRLLLEFRRALTGRGLAFLAGRCLSFGGAIPYLPILDIVRGQCGVVDTDVPDTVAGRVRGALAELGLDPASTAPYLLRLLGRPGAQEPGAALSPETVRARTFDAVRRLLLAASARSPLVLTVEDLHWVDRTSEELLAGLADGLGDARILLVASYRPGYQPPWIGRSYATQMALSPLAMPDSLAVVQAALPRLTDPVARLILNKAEGNPFFLEELARAVGDPASARGEVVVPDTVQGVLAARIDRLPEAAKRVVQTASVLGREFPRRLLEAVAAGGALDRELTELVRQEFLRERPGPEGPSYVFKHALTQDVALASLLASRRRELHRRVAEALVLLHPGGDRDLEPELAHHYFEAEAWAEAAEHARRAAEAAAAVHANREALERYEQAMIAAERAGLPPAARVILHEARADVHAVLGAFEPARVDLEAGLALASTVGDRLARARLLRTLAMLWGGHKDYARGLDLAREAVEASRAAGDRRLLAESMVQVGIMRMNLARLREAVADLEGALALFAELGDERGRVRTLDALGMARTISGDLDGAVAAGEDAARRAALLGDRETEMTALSMVAFTRGFQGRWADGQEAAGRSLEIAVAIGARRQEAYQHAAVGVVLELLGVWGEALRSAQLGLAMARDIGHLEWTVVGLSVVGRVLRQVGEVEEARRLHEEELETARALRAAIWVADALGGLGEVLDALGEAGPARALFEEALSTSAEAVEFGVRALLALADLDLREGRPVEALARAREIRASHGAFRVFAADALRVEGEALEALGETGPAERALRGARAEAAVLEARSVDWRAALALGRLMDRRGRPAEGASERAEARARLAVAAAGLPPDLLDSLRRTAPWREAHGRE